MEIKERLNSCLPSVDKDCRQRATSTSIPLPFVRSYQNSYSSMSIAKLAALHTEIRLYSNAKSTLHTFTHGVHDCKMAKQSDELLLP